MKGEAIALTAARSRASDFVALAKPRLNLLVVASALAGYVMAGGDLANAVVVVSTVIGTALVAGGASAFNQVIERVPDSLMRRTRFRPVPDGRLQPVESLVFATALALHRDFIGRGVLRAVLIIPWVISAVAASSDSQPWTAARPMFLSGVIKSNRWPPKPWTTENGYPAGPVSCTISTPAAPSSAAFSYL